ncbi:hypothetical protein QBC37DRAFT_404999 [Rhypophila decipiens]|uniref:Uncharacterized protein n=1 Tax=Rhypophila decipiens TaxID=261697 RepID=A0AAN6Y3J8_9PEZI|nr:hypothetical protein QBC37DRAFT_404999 [Rhypophila decipiens]
MTKKFPPTGKLDKVYEYQKDGKTLRFDPMQWVVEKKQLWGLEFQTINVPEGAKRNPQINDPILKVRIQAHINLFNNDGEDQRGKGLINYDPRNAGTNGRHQHVIATQKRVVKAYGKTCKTLGAVEVSILVPLIRV